MCNLRTLSPFVIYLFILWYWGLSLPLEPFHQPFFVMSFFKTVSHKLFAPADFKHPSSWSLPPEYLGLQTWATSAQPFSPLLGGFFTLLCLSFTHVKQSNVYV
jgi:hypothetical protein